MRLERYFLVVFSVIMLGPPFASWAAQGSQSSAPSQNGDKTKNKNQDQPTPPTQEDPDFNLVLGIGSLITGPDETNYHVVNNNVLQAQTTGRATPQFLTGLAFRLPFHDFPWRSTPIADTPCILVTPRQHDNCKDKTNNVVCVSSLPTKDGSKQDKNTTDATKQVSRPCLGRFQATDKPWSAFVSLKFAPNSTNTLNGYVIGGSYRLAKYLDLLLGYALTPFDEPSPGFQQIAAQAVRNNPNIAAYKTFNADNLQKNVPLAFDGFPILTQTGSSGQSTPLFAGSPLTTRYHGGFIIGISFPLAIYAKLPSKQ